jgi:Baseplate J-like protein
MNGTCGCCEGLEPLTPLAIANRPGLSALAYRAGTHATFLETMKARLSSGEYPALARLTTRDANDPAIAMLDAWASVADVLTFYQERIANEGYLRTATERRSILELAWLVGYALRPGVAASVYLAFTLEAGHATEIPAGTRAQSLPGPGELPQPFETAERLEARAVWNVLTPRRSRPQPPRQWDRTGRLYLKGVATDLKPNDPLLIASGQSQSFLRIESVEPDPAADRTLVTLQTPAAREEPGYWYEGLREQLDHFLDLEHHEVSLGTTAQRVVRMLDELKSDVASAMSPERLVDLLQRKYLPQLEEELKAVRNMSGATRLEPWIGEIFEHLRREEAELRAGLSYSHSTTGANAATVAPSATFGNGDGSLERLEEKLERLAVPPSSQPANALRLPRSLVQTFDPASDTVPRLLVAMQPALGRDLYRAWEQAAAEQDDARIYALRISASPFGHNAPLEPILGKDGAILGSREWTLEKIDRSDEEFFGVDVTVAPPPPAGAAHIFTVEVIIADESKTHGPQSLQNGAFSLAFAGETVEGTLSGVAGGSFLLKLDFATRQMTVEIGEQVPPPVVINLAGEEPPSGARITVDIKQTGAVTTTSTGVDRADAEVSSDQTGARRILVTGATWARVPTEQANIISLDNLYEEILPGSWIVVERPYPVGDIPKVVKARIEEVHEGSRADYGIPAKSTRVTLPEDKPWIAPEQDTFAVIRGTSVYAQGELLELAEAPLERIDNDGVVEVEPVCGRQIELDALYDGLESGRWLFVTGEREDLPGVTASELVMLAGVEQGIQQATLTTKDLLQRSVGEVRSVRVAGKGSTGPGGHNLTILAYLLPDGSAAGHAHLAGGATGDVVRVVPPSGTRDFWCINVKRTDTDPKSGDQRINWYIRDVGDGETTFDEISYVTSMGEATCPDPTGAWLTLTEGDFQASEDLPGDKPHSTLVLANDLAYCYRRETVEIYANVARATHGETRSEVLGSGDGSKALQRFGLKQSPLTYVAAATPSGAESTLEVFVNDVRWHEAERLAGLERADRRFITQTDDQDEVTLVFGDGERGARLPTGVENVRAVYRTGIGKVGNAAERQISQLATRPLGLKGVINPLPATGGADREGRDQARRNAPLAVMALDRLVSVRDYADFARTFAGIGKASAARLSDGRRQLVHLTIAGAGDITIAKNSDLYRKLVQALRQFGDPHQPLRVEVRELIVLIVSARVRVLPDYQWEKVEPKIRAALLDTFGFERRELGQDALLSEVIGTVQKVPGVAYIDVDTFGGVPEKTTGTMLGERRSLTLTEIVGRIQDLGLNPRVPVELAGLQKGAIHPAQLAFLTPGVPDTLILQEITS